MDYVNFVSLSFLVCLMGTIDVPGAFVKIELDNLEDLTLMFNI